MRRQNQAPDDFQIIGSNSWKFLAWRRASLYALKAIVAAKMKALTGDH